MTEHVAGQNTANFMGWGETTRSDILLDNRRCAPKAEVRHAVDGVGKVGQSLDVRGAVAVEEPGPEVEQEAGNAQLQQLHGLSEQKCMAGQLQSAAFSERDGQTGRLMPKGVAREPLNKSEDVPPRCAASVEESLATRHCMRSRDPWIGYLLLGEVAVGEEGVDHDASCCASRVRQFVVDHQRLAH